MDREKHASEFFLGDSQRIANGKAKGRMHSADCGGGKDGSGWDFQAYALQNPPPRVSSALKAGQKRALARIARRVIGRGVGACAVSA